MKKALFAALSLGAACLAHPSAAQDMDMSEEEVATLARIAMPAAFRGLQVKCDPVLGADAYMFASGDMLEARLTTASNSATPQVSGLIARMSAQGNPQMAEVLAGMPPEALVPFFNEMIAGMVTSRIEADDCATIDRVLFLLDPLPPENLAQLLAFFYAESRRSRAEGEAIETVELAVPPRARAKR